MVRLRLWPRGNIPPGPEGLLSRPGVFRRGCVGLGAAEQGRPVGRPRTGGEHSHLRLNLVVTLETLGTECF